jgi:acyl-CoA thioesterase FadM
MNEYISNAMQTRFSDLDTQRHVTSRTYEAFAYDARMAALNEIGLTKNAMIENNIKIRHKFGYAKFGRQQYEGAILFVKSRIRPMHGYFLWDQSVYDTEGLEVCRLQLGLEYLQNDLVFSPVFSQIEMDIAPLWDEIQPFSLRCERSENEYTLPFCERDMFGDYPVTSMWKVFEEGRWLFISQMGLTLEKLKQLDTTSFYMGGSYEYYKPLQENMVVQVKTWIERFDRIRFFFRHEVYHNNELMMAQREEQLIVSLSRAKPQRASETFQALVQSHTEFTDYSPFVRK